MPLLLAMIAKATAETCGCHACPSGGFAAFVTPGAGVSVVALAVSGVVHAAFLNVLMGLL